MQGRLRGGSGNLKVGAPTWKGQLQTPEKEPAIATCSIPRGEEPYSFLELGKASRPVGICYATSFTAKLSSLKVETA